jgi:hypothetical protein
LAGNKFLKIFSLIPTFESRHSPNPASLSEQAAKDYRPNSDRMNLENEFRRNVSPKPDSAQQNDIGQNQK